MAKTPITRVTLTDVAQMAGVAPSTVSYILRQVEPHFSRYAKDTIARVQQAAAKTGYTPNLLASSLRRQQLPYFGIFFEMVRTGDPGPAGGLSSMMWQVYEGIAATARKGHRYPVLLTSPDPALGLAESPADLDLIVRSGLSGIIAAVYPQTWSEHVARWDNAGIPCISLFDPGPLDQPRWYVDLDNPAVGKLASQYLLQRGHGHVFCLHQAHPTREVSDRIAAFCANHEAAGQHVSLMELAWSKDGVCRVDQSGRDRLVDTVRKAEATALFGADGGSTMIAHQALTEQQVRIPEQCSLIGIDVSPWSVAAQVVTEVACPGRLVGQEAAKMLASRLSGQATRPRSVLVKPIVYERTSVAKIGGPVNTTG